MEIYINKNTKKYLMDRHKAKRGSHETQVHKEVHKNAHKGVNHNDAKYHDHANLELKKEVVKKYHDKLQDLKDEIGKAVVGQHEVIDGFLRGLLARGHVLVEGVPGIAKTHLIKTLAIATGCKGSRIQFTVDLLPTDITGLTIYDQHKGFYTQKGPIFANFVLADEINRAPPKTQSALLEAMQEKQVTIGGKTYPLDEPFFVMATQNPIESEGTYRLPEAQVDRFLYKLLMGYPKMDEEKQVLKINATLRDFKDFKIKQAISPREIIEMQKMTHKIYLSSDIEDYILRIVEATRNPDKYKLRTGKYIEYGGSPRASISLFISAKAQAILQGNNYVTPQYVKDVAKDVLRHRIILNYEGQAEKITNDQIVDEILSKVPVQQN